jgi:excinuclease ABC subunit A
MQLLADVTIPCEECGGGRFNAATLEVYFKGRNIHDILEMSVTEAREFFQAHPKIRRGLEMLNRIGLGYIKLGQPSTTLSGGEAQRVKLAKELQKPGTGRTMYLLDEPTTGLHFKDIATLLQALQSLADQGNSLVVIEHNPEVIKSADYLIDLGPGGGNAGGEIVAAGTPEQIVRNKKSYTGKALKPFLKPEKAFPVKAVTRLKQQRQFKDIVIRGGYKHNLKNISVTIPRHKLTVIWHSFRRGAEALY